MCRALDQALTLYHLRNPYNHPSGNYRTSVLQVRRWAREAIDLTHSWAVSEPRSDLELSIQEAWVPTTLLYQICSQIMAAQQEKGALQEQLQPWQSRWDLKCLLCTVPGSEESVKQLLLDGWNLQPENEWLPKLQPNVDFVSDSLSSSVYSFCANLNPGRASDVIIAVSPACGWIILYLLHFSL